MKPKKYAIVLYIVFWIISDMYNLSYLHGFKYKIKSYIYTFVMSMSILLALSCVLYLCYWTSTLCFDNALMIFVLTGIFYGIACLICLPVINYVMIIPGFIVLFLLQERRGD